MVPSQLVLFMATFHKHHTGKKTYLQLKGIRVRKQNARAVFLDLLRDSVGSCGQSCLIQRQELQNLVPQTENPVTQQSFMDRISLYLPLPPSLMLPSPTQLAPNPGCF